MNRYLSTTLLIDYENDAVRKLSDRMGWMKLERTERIREIYSFVRDSILFGYSSRDEKKASEVIADGIGQCNTKGILLMALLRGAGIPCRFHGSLVDKRFQKGVMPLFVYLLSPRLIVHGWVEVLHCGQWISLEGVVIDEEYILAIRKRVGTVSAPFFGYGIAADDLNQPCIYWTGSDTHIQKNAIATDLGVFDDPDSFFALHSQRLNPFSRWLYGRFVCRLITEKADRLRKGI